MEQVMIEAAKSSPMLVVLVVLVVIFLRHIQSISDIHSLGIKEMMASHAKRTDEFIATVKEMKDEDRETRVQNTTALNSLCNEVTRLSERFGSQDHHRH